MNCDLPMPVTGCDETSKKLNDIIDFLTTCLPGDHQHNCFNYTVTAQASTAVIPLPHIPVGASETVNLNTAILQNGQGYTISGSILTLNPGFDLYPGYCVQICYEYV